MIVSLRGRVTEFFSVSMVIEVGGVGYRVIVAPSTLEHMTVGEEAFVYIHDHIREDAHDLYGFLIKDELELFERLLAVSGVGPKVALAILSVGKVDEVRNAIMRGDLDRLTSVPGIGKKTAQKIILELKGQLVEQQESSSTDRDAIAALESLGYSSAQAREALKKVKTEITDTSARVREALRLLSG